MSADSPHSLSDELFCTQFELQTLSGILVGGGLERWVPGFTSVSTGEHHEKRYQWATQFAAGKRVLDMACGAGRGSYLLATMGQASSVLGVDIDEGAVRYASIRYAHQNIEHLVADAQAFRSDSKFDLVVGFETIEHLQDVSAYLRSVASVLEPNGVFLVSSPISKKPLDTHPNNPFHVREWGIKAFADELSAHFRIEKTFLQLRQPPESPLMGLLPPLFKAAKSGFTPWNPVDMETLPSAKSPGVKLKGLQIVLCRPLG